MNKSRNSRGVSSGVPAVRSGVGAVTVDAEAAWAEAQDRQETLLGQAGLSLPHRWPVIDGR